MPAALPLEGLPAPRDSDLSCQPAEEENGVERAPNSLPANPDSHPPGKNQSHGRPCGLWSQQRLHTLDSDVWGTGSRLCTMLQLLLAPAVGLSAPHPAKPSSEPADMACASTADGPGPGDRVYLGGQLSSAGISFPTPGRCRPSHLPTPAAGSLPEVRVWGWGTL